MTRRGYLDWLRGIGVLIMIAGHTLDSWVQLAERTRPIYRWSLVVTGIGAPIFLFLAGVALPLAAGARMRRGLTAPEAAARSRRRGWQVFGLAFLFRLQGYLISGGTLPTTLLKVDILNVLGLGMVAAALLWGWGRTGRHRAGLLLGAALAVAMVTPLVRTWEALAMLPDPLEWYLRPAAGHTTFTLLPWIGFLLAGAAVGIWIETTHDPEHERRVNHALAAIGVAAVVIGYGTSLLPPIYDEVSFWTTSPSFFLLRLGVLLLLVPAAYLWMRAWPGWSPIREIGVASLFVYWIHVEMVYGTPSAAIRHGLSIEQAALGAVALAVLLFALVRLKRVVIGNAPIARLRSAMQTVAGTGTN